MPLVLNNLRIFADENTVEKIPSGNGFEVDSLDFLEAGTYMFETELLKDWTSFYVVKSSGFYRIEITCAVTSNTKDTARNFIGCPVYLMNERPLDKKP